ncbi:hypothetical protein BKA70DRAFT_1323675 [Coprinopsis sp. MPI-PUGE-AT-0042]|nr:hypothetical protein BKA70DRAFT_1323675 [Coprinopsis sp. MPI-PUGE-AT-0042]
MAKYFCSIPCLCSSIVWRASCCMGSLTMMCVRSLFRTELTKEGEEGFIVAIDRDIQPRLSCTWPTPIISTSTYSSATRESRGMAWCGIPIVPTASLKIANSR